MGSTKVQAPPPRDYYKEMSDTIRAQIDLAPQMMEAEKRLIPQWQAMQKEQMLAQADNLKTFYRDVMGDSANLLTQYGTTFADALAPIGQGARRTYEASLGGGAEIQNRMRASALDDLSAGTGLTADMERQSQQAMRSAYSARGMANTNQGLAAEVLGNYQLGLARQDRARTFASSVLGNDVNIAGNAYSQYGSPLMQTGLAALSPMGLAGLATQYNQTLGPTYLQPESQYSANLVAANQNNQLQASVATAQGNSAIWGGLASGIGGGLVKKFG
jgi:hypothetical protein